MGLYGHIYMCVYRYPMKLGEKGQMIHVENLKKWIGLWEIGPEQSETNWSALLHAAKHQTTCSKCRLAHTLLL